jgi:MSHA pilin protein MshC
MPNECKRSVRMCLRVRGFTLIELIMVIIMMGILAAFAAPRMFNISDFNARGLHDQSLALLRYAQKTAIAQRRTVCVTFASNTLSLSIASAAGTYDCSSAGTLVGPNGSHSVPINSGASYSGTPTSFNFDGLGQPITSAGVAQATQTIQVTGLTSSIVIENGTGYVHE